MKTAHETLAEFIQLMKDFELYWGEILQNYIDEDNFGEFYSEENKIKLSEGIKSIQHKFFIKKGTVIDTVSTGGFNFSNATRI